ncbi:MAG: hypothetical protein QM733_17070 [Ilumatobacteraceae bacterium]
MGRFEDAELYETVVAALGGEALSLATLRSRLGAPWDAPIGRDDLDRLLQFDSRFVEVRAGFVHAPALLAGTAWTVWVDPDGGADGYVRMRPDLDVLGWWLTSGDVAVIDAGGRHVGELEVDDLLLGDGDGGDDVEVVVGPDGWLAGLIGRWATVAVIGEALRWTPLERPPAATARQIAALVTAFGETANDGEHRSAFLGPMPDDWRFMSGSAAVNEALLIDPAAFRDDPIPALGELYSAAGFERHGSLIAEAGFDWDALHAWQDRNRLSLIHGLSAQQADALAAFLAGLDDVMAADVTGVTVLDDSAVATAAWSELEHREALHQGVGALRSAGVRRRRIDRRRVVPGAVARSCRRSAGGCRGARASGRRPLRARAGVARSRRLARRSWRRGRRAALAHPSSTRSARRVE